ncbi:MAG: dTDP-4-dehydrorhamnose reductase [Nitrosomonas sp.]|nr:dTDP-4-dehydrorhamnose reductase [Nitrosomonas sp.]MCC7136000.1 dTDP-4-dehydrorhamnose reductase [Nitrosomonas sp.]
MKILLLGKNGQVGWELQRSLTLLGELIALDRHDSRYCGDLADQAGILRTLQTIQPAVIVNAAAYTAVDKAESDVDTTYQINARTPGLLAEQARKTGACLIHYSTDYVFDGSGDRPWRESDTTAPLNIYGHSKLQGETAIIESGCNHLILRTSWVYGAMGQNFAKTILRLAQERDQLTIINDQFGAPTGAELLADITARIIPQLMINPELSGKYHVSAQGEATWYTYAKLILDFAREKQVAIKAGSDNIVPVATKDFATAAIRPLNSRLDTSRFRNVFQLNLPPWQTGVIRMLTELIALQNLSKN